MCCQICGELHPSLPTSEQFDFKPLADLGFSQIDDYFGIPSKSDDGDDVIVWLFPLKGGQAVHHDPGSFDGVRLTYSVLSNPTSRQPLFEQVLKTMASLTHSSPLYVARDLELGPPDLSMLVADMDSIAKHWREQGIEPGSDEAMQIDY